MTIATFLSLTSDMGRQNVPRHASYRAMTDRVKSIGQLHDDVILLQLPESLSLSFSCAN